MIYEIYNNYQGAQALSYFRFYIYKAIRKVLFLPILTERSYL